MLGYVRVYFWGLYQAGCGITTPLGEGMEHFYILEVCVQVKAVVGMKGKALNPKNQ